jgi:hypothetical protein
MPYTRQTSSRSHQLFDHRAEITRQVVLRSDGIEAVTESVNPEVTRLFPTHVASMLARGDGGTDIGLRPNTTPKADRLLLRYRSGVLIAPSGSHARLVGQS